MSDVTNPFLHQEEARRYHRFRPYYQYIPAQLLNEYFHGKKIPKVLDAACGTGHSTKALREICENIVGTDISEAMLKVARENLDVQFVQAPAEKLPFSAQSFDYVHMSMAFHWLDQQAFLGEARRVLKPMGFLGIDNYGFTGKMKGNESLKEKFSAFDKKLGAKVPRNPDYPSEQSASQCGFRFVQEFRYDHEAFMTSDEFVNYTLTRSNFQFLSDEERAQVGKKMDELYSPIFENQSKPLVFRGILKLYQAN